MTSLLLPHIHSENNKETILYSVWIYQVHPMLQVYLCNAFHQLKVLWIILSTLKLLKFVLSPMTHLSISTLCLKIPMLIQLYISFFNFSLDLEYV
jgi:hypothetical protein